MDPRVSSKAKRGFSLIELIVAIVIIGLLTTLVLVDFRTGRFNDELRFAAEQLAGDLRELQTFSLTGFIPRDTSGAIPDGGFGFFAETGNGSYVLYADRSAPLCSPNHRYLDPDIVGCAIGDTADRILENDGTTFPAAVHITNVTTGAADCPDAESEIDIVFVPPRGTVSFCGTDASSIATITLVHEQTQRTRSVLVNGVTGQVSVE